jgi:hypothetical protein
MKGLEIAKTIRSFIILLFSKFKIKEDETDGAYINA